MLPLTYQFHLDPAETVRASRSIQRRQRFAWTSWAVWPLFVGMAALYLATGARWQDLWLLALAALFVGALTALTPWIQRRQLRRAYAETPMLREPQIYRFSDEGLAISGGAATTTLGWEAILEAAETEEFFLLFYSKRCAYYLPKRVVGGATEQASLRDMLRTRLGSRAASRETFTHGNRPM